MIRFLIACAIVMCLLYLLVDWIRNRKIKGKVNDANDRLHDVRNANKVLDVEELVVEESHALKQRINALKQKEKTLESDSETV